MDHLEQKEGYRFCPTDSEGLKFLLRFIAKQEMHDAGFITTNIDVYNEEPWEIYSQGVHCGGLDDYDESSYRYFITKKSKICNGEVVNKGNWKQEDEGKPIFYNRPNLSSAIIIGSKKKMYYDGNWIMKEYELSMIILHKFDEDRRDYVLCAIKKNNCSYETSTYTITGTSW